MAGSPAHTKALRYSTLNQPRMRMLRPNRAILIASLFCLLACVVMWILSCFTRLTVGFYGHSLILDYGSAWILWRPGQTCIDAWWNVDTVVPIGRDFRTYGFILPVFKGRPRGVDITLPLWVPTLVASLPAILVAAHARRLRRRGACAKCCYDLTGNVTGRCPECGTHITCRSTRDG